MCRPAVAFKLCFRVESIVVPHKQTRICKTRDRRGIYTEIYNYEVLQIYEESSPSDLPLPAYKQYS
jgi:hypothetical protein